MLNRTNSYLKRIKTEKTDRNCILNWKPSNKTPSNKNELTSRSPAHREICQKIQLRQRDRYILKCINHPVKKATFEPKQSLKQAYCQDCSIKLVKHNMRMVRLTEQSLHLRNLYQAQMQRIANHEEEAKQILNRFFQAQRQSIKIAFVLAKQNIQKPFKLPYFKIQNLNDNEMSQKIQQLFGHVQFKKVQFVKNGNGQMSSINTHQRNLKSEVDLLINQENKENVEINNFTKVSIDSRLKRLSSRDGQRQLVCHR